MKTEREIVKEMDRILAQLKASERGSSANTILNQRYISLAWVLGKQVTTTKVGRYWGRVDTLVLEKFTFSLLNGLQYGLQ